MCKMAGSGRRARSLNSSTAFSGLFFSISIDSRCQHQIRAEFPPGHFAKRDDVLQLFSSLPQPRPGARRALPKSSARKEDDALGQALGQKGKRSLRRLPSTSRLVTLSAPSLSRSHRRSMRPRTAGAGNRLTLGKAATRRGRSRLGHDDRGEGFSLVCHHFGVQRAGVGIEDDAAQSLRFLSCGAQMRANEGVRLGSSARTVLMPTKTVSAPRRNRIPKREPAHW